ncbi:MAG: 3'(2'),5'-bisphosphate nucleotidase CysQ [Oligoflexales bacterium]
MSLTSEIISKVQDLTREAGALILEKKKAENIQSRAKFDGSPVSDVDFLVNQMLLTALSKLTNSIPVISEETTLQPFEARKKWRRYWCIDPLDGTTEFLSGGSEYAVNIALIEGGVPLFGCIGIPEQGVVYCGAKGYGTWKVDAIGQRKELAYKPQRKDQTIVAVSKTDQLEKIKSMLRTTAISEWRPVSSSIKFCLLAESKVDIYARSVPCYEWDVASGDALLRYLKGYPFPIPFVYNTKELKVPGFVLGMKA